jgi:predicted AlkP superfamily pyrophosphatase or phosphodiesterase
MRHHRSTLVLLTLLTTAQMAHGLSAPPRLVVLVAIDQMPREYLDRFGSLFGAGGFRQLLERGADYGQCHHDHLGTFTGPGHSVMLTGAYPMNTGIVDNTWYSRAAGREVGCVEDPRTTIVRSPSASVDGAEPGVAPPSSFGTTVGDALRLATGMRARVVSAAIKDRSAVLMGGQRPNGAYWFDGRTCTFVSSTFYDKHLPAWLDAFNGRHVCQPYLNQSWTKLQSTLDYSHHADIDDAPYERPAFNLGRTFPHPVTEFILTDGDPARRERDRYSSVTATPAGGEILLQLATAAIAGESLGADDVPDVLALGFSSNDLVGHMYGTQSQEVLDITLRTDRMLAQLMELLDAKVGRDRWLLVLTSDHGIAPTPEYLEQLHVLPMRDDHHRLTSATMKNTVERALVQRYFGTSPPPAGFHSFITAWLAPFVYINPETPALLPGHPSFDAVLEAVREETLKLNGIARVYVRAERDKLAGSNDTIDRRVYHSWHVGNGGDLIVVTAPYWLDTDTVATTHGTPYGYDTHVPMILYGAGIRAGRYDRTVAVADLAPTLARILGVTPPPMSTGEVLREALQ